MSGIHKILVPVDFSSCSRSALEKAVELSERYFGAAIDVLHVWEPPRSLPAGTRVIAADGAATSIEQAARVEVMREMEALLSEHEAKGIVTFHRLHENGEPVPVILEAAKKGKYDLMIVGTHGRTGLAHDYLGSVAEKLVRRAPCLVLAVHEAKPSADSTRAASAERVSR